MLNTCIPFLIQVSFIVVFILVFLSLFRCFSAVFGSCYLRRDPHFLDILTSFLQRNPSRPDIVLRTPTALCLGFSCKVLSFSLIFPVCHSYLLFTQYIINWTWFITFIIISEIFYIIYLFTGGPDRSQEPRLASRFPGEWQGHKRLDYHLLISPLLSASVSSAHWTRRMEESIFTLAESWIGSESARTQTRLSHVMA